MKVFYAERQPLLLPEGHHFPAPKYGRLLERVEAAGLVPADDLRAAEPASDVQLERVHTHDYVRRMTLGQMTEKEMRRIGFPWSPELVDRVRRSVGATIAACQAALDDGMAGNLGGGTHHAYAEHGEGYCVFNDVAVAARAMLAEGRTRRIVILDLDVHQGNGSAAIFVHDPEVFTFSTHGQKNFPYHKEHGDLDIALVDGTKDAVFLAAVQMGTAHALKLAQADLAIYIAGADPYEDDRLGRLRVSKSGLAERDRMVIEMCWRMGLPIALVMGGGYARQIEDTVEIHLQTYRIATRLAGG